MIVRRRLARCARSSGRWPAHAARPGARGIGDPYFPHAGNGGYDVRHYGLDVAYSPKTRPAPRRRDDRRDGRRRSSRASTSTSTGCTSARSRSTARPRAGRRRGGELTITPRTRAAARAAASRTVDRLRRRAGDARTARSARGFIHTDDGALIAGEPDGRRHLVPGQRPPARQGLLLVPHHACRAGSRRSPTASCWASSDRGPATTLALGGAASRWRPYLATASIGQFELRAVRGRRDQGTGTRSTPTCCRARSRAAAPVRAARASAQPSYKRLARTINVPARRREAVVLGPARHRARAPTSSSSRPAPAGRRATGRRCPTQDGHARRTTGYACSAC